MFKVALKMAEIEIKPVNAVEDVDLNETKETEATCGINKETKPDIDLEDVELISKDNNVEPTEKSNKRPSSTEVTVMDDDKVQSGGTDKESNNKEARKTNDTKPEKDNSSSSLECVLKTKPVEDNGESAKSESEPVKPPDTNSADSDIEEIITQEEEKLNEILKVVHNDVELKHLENDAQQTGVKKKECAKEENEEIEEKEEELEEVKEKEDLSSNSGSTQAESVKTLNKEDVSVVNEDASEVEPMKLTNSADTEEIMVQSEEQSEVGIVGPPTTASELINEDELRAESVLSSESKTQDHVAEWVQNSAKADLLISVTTEEEENNIHDNRHRRKNLGGKRSRKKKSNDLSTMPVRKSQRIVTNIIKKSIKCLNKMHAMEGNGGNGKKVDAAEKTRDDDTSRASPKVPQSQQNGAALPEETAAATTAADRLRSSSIKKEPHCDSESELTTKNHSSAETMQQKVASTRCSKSETEGKGGSSGRKRKSTDGQLSSNGNSAPKKFCLEQREQYISSLVGCEKVTAEELAVRADQLRAEVQALDELARAKEMEWNEILSMRKLKEEAYLRIERRRQVMGFMEGNGQLGDTLPPASMSLGPDWENSDNMTSVSKEKCGFELKEDLPEENSQELLAFKKEKNSKSASQRQTTPPKQSGENGRKQAEALSPEYRQIGEGRQGAIVDVKSIIADHRLRHPETVPRRSRGRRMRNSVNVGLGAGGAMVETGHSVDSRPSSTDSCKSNPNAVDPNNSMSFKDVLVQFAKLSQQQGEPVKTPQNYPDVTLHPVAPSPVPQNTPPQQTGSLLHGILTKSQSPRPTTFSPTLARLLTAPERERNTPTATSIPQQTAATQHLLQAYQGSNPVSISDLLSSSKARTEITITPVVNTPVQSHSNSLIHVEDVEEESAVIEDRETRVSTGGRDNRDDRDSPPRCQGCHERAAQFVCAGCGNQWYCSRECQVAAWDEHSEVCSG